jgi:transcriptional regulator with XRE-family HTH domain
VEELRRTRKERGLTQRGLANASGVDQATISQVESGKHRPRLETLDKLADALGVEVGAFFQKSEPTPGPRSLSWTLSAPTKEYSEWVLNAESADLHKLWILIGEYAQKLEVGEPHRFVVDRAQAAINQYFRLNPPSAVRPRKVKREVETAQEKAVNE